MNKFSRPLCAVIAAAAMIPLFGICSTENTPVSEADSVVSISPYNAYRINNGVFEGWGTSLCWWANRIGYSDSLSEKAAEAFFGDNGLRMNIARFNIGGGDDPTHDHITRTDSNMPGYTVYNNGTVTYDWNADANQRNVLFKSIAACKEDLIVEMFSNSPPYYMTQSGCSTGNKDAGKNNLKDDCYDDFANYLAEVCRHYEDVWGVDVQSVEPMNEPYTNFWGAYSYKQEGCHFDIGASESKILLETQRAMAERGMSDVILCGTDETSIDTQIDAYKALSSDAKNAISRIDTHTYGGSKRNELQSLALSAGKNLWMSEVDGNGTSGVDAGQMAPALWLSQRIIGDCNGLGCSAWIVWQAIDKHICEAGYNGKKDSGMPDINTGFWGLAVADHDKDDIILTKKYYAFGQFSRFIRPGFTMLNSSDSTLVGYDSENDQLVIVAVNTQGKESKMNFDLSAFKNNNASVKTVRTSLTENWAELPSFDFSGSVLDVSLAANSVTTFIIDGVDAGKMVSSLTEIPLSSDMITGSSPWNNSANDCKKVVDGDLSSFFDGVGSGWVQIDLGKEYTVDAVAFAPRRGYEYRCVDAVIAASADGTNWDVITKIAGKPFGGLNYVTKFDEGNSYRYIKYYVPDGKPTTDLNKDNVYCCNLAEIKVYGAEKPAAPVIIKGDVNNDGVLNTADIVKLRDAMLGVSEITDEQYETADLDENGKIDIIDYILLLSKFLEK